MTAATIADKREILQRMGRQTEKSLDQIPIETLDELVGYLDDAIHKRMSVDDARLKLFKESRIPDNEETRHIFNNAFLGCVRMVLATRYVQRYEAENQQAEKGE